MSRLPVDFPFLNLGIQECVHQGLALTGAGDVLMTGVLRNSHDKGPVSANQRACGSLMPFKTPKEETSSGSSTALEETQARRLLRNCEQVTISLRTPFILDRLEADIFPGFTIAHQLAGNPGETVLRSGLPGREPPSTCACRLKSLSGRIESGSL